MEIREFWASKHRLHFKMYKTINRDALLANRAQISYRDSIVLLSIDTNFELVSTASIFMWDTIPVGQFKSIRHRSTDHHLKLYQQYTDSIESWTFGMRLFDDRNNVLWKKIQSRDLVHSMQPLPGDKFIGTKKISNRHSIIITYDLNGEEDTVKTFDYRNGKTPYNAGPADIQISLIGTKKILITYKMGTLPKKTRLCAEILDLK